MVAACSSPWIRYQSTHWKGAGLNAVHQAGLSEYHRLVEAPDYLALPDLLNRQTPVNFAYIDGWHRFEYALLDFFYVDKMLLSVV